MNKLLIALSLSAVSFNTFSAPLIDVPLAKKCYNVHLKLAKIAEAQTTEQCQYELNQATYQSKSAALSVSEDSYYARYALENAIFALRHAQVYSCAEEDKIVEAEMELAEIKTSVPK